MQPIPTSHDLAYLWEGEEWEIVENCGTTVRLSVRYEHPEGPTIEEIRLLRRLLPELGQLPPAEAKRIIGRGNSYWVGEFGLGEGSHLVRRGEALGLTMLVERKHWMIAEPIHLIKRTTLRIEEEATREEVYQKMKAAGRPVVGQSDEY